MTDVHLSSAEKKRAEIGRRKRSIRNFLLKPQTWKAGVSALDFILKLARVVYKVWNMFQ